MRLAPPLSNGEGPPPDELETLLSSYFRAEMPAPWPAPPLMRATPQQPAAARTARGLTRSRMALAASVALLIAGTVAMPGRSPSRPTPEKVPLISGGPEARRPDFPEATVQPKSKSAESGKQVIENVTPRK
jgi:hypothetical protein